MTELVQVTELQKISDGLDAFDKRKSEIETLAESAKSIDVTSSSDKSAYKLVVDKRKELKAARVAIEKEGKSMRDLITPITKMISSKEKELVSIISPEEDRLFKREFWFDQEQDRIKKEAEELKKAAIQKRIDQLAEYNSAIDYFLVSEMSDELFETKLAESKLEFETEQQRIEAEKQAAENLRLEEIKRQETIAEQNRIEAEKLKAEQEQLRIERDKMAAERKAIDDEKAKIEAEKQAAIDAENKRKADEEAEKQKQAEIDKAKKDAAEKAIADQKAKEERERIAAERKAARQPDKVKLEQLAITIDELNLPTVKSQEAIEIIAEVEKRLSSLNDYLRTQTSNL